MEIWDAWKTLHAKNPTYLLNCEDGWIFPYIQRLRGREKHLFTISNINRKVFGCPPKVLHSILFFNISPDPWCSSPKPTKFDEKKLELIKPYIKGLYKWSEYEFNLNKPLIIKLMKNKEFIKEINFHVSLEKKEAKAFGLEYVTYKPKPVKKQTSISLANF